MATASSPAVDDDLRAYSKREIQERLGVSERTVDRLIDRGELKTVFPRRSGVPTRVTARSLRELMYGGAQG
ncbi:hypothetical protein nbrc107696_31010 [Gordonia spumicola]|uniref:Helix-turn-helix domain-containing protein n=1 Tax=Gordonia spumicola TaxID=589161 RepID=A0A7I9VBE5_9ACTN|nr:helix-turn-helix domain-containing protein [Gordonia spumicola]GEE02655.1 hypothetical protein nbrc107696_31010 [Gordonia spumicola]